MAPKAVYSIDGCTPSNARVSDVWNYAAKIREDTGKISAKCHLCEMTVPCSNGSTTGIAKHLDSQHNVRISKKRKLSPAVQNQIALNSGDSFSALSQEERLAVIWSRNGLSFKLVDDVAFRNHFKSCIPDSVDRHKLSKLTVELGNNWLDKSLHELSGATGSLSLDMYTSVAGDKMLNFVFHNGTKRKPFFLKSVYMEQKRVQDISSAMAAVLHELTTRGITVIGVVADNEPAMQLALGALHAKDPGIITARCMAHSLQLVLKDLTKEITAIKSTIDQVNSILSQYRKSDFRRKLIQNGETHKLIRPVETRWSTNIDAMERIIQSRPFLENILTLTSEQWSEMETVFTFLLPFRIATDILQADSSSIFEGIEALANLRLHLESRNDIFRDKTLACLTKREANHWSMDIHRLALLVTPKTNYTTMKKQQLQENRELLERYIHSIKKKLGHSIDSTELKEDVTAWINRSRNDREGDGHDVRQFWANESIVYPHVGMIAHVLGKIPPSEASVERCFSHQKLLHTPLRNSLNVDKVNASMFIRMAHDKILRMS